ncbi:MAG: hypothetical protein E7500_02525 [Ruminococcus sp.]|nr:hypothetical protein [Ruminococcus sp.]
MKKSILSAVITVASAVSACAYSSLFASASADDFHYVTSPDGTGINILSYGGTGPEMVIPDTIDGLPVKLINTNAFKSNLDITGVKIPDTVIAISTGAFEGCSNLKSIKLPSSLTKLYTFAFSECRALESVTFGDNVTTIERYAFQLCTGLKEISIPGSVKTIADHTFQSCTGMKRITFEEGVQTIEADAMLNATSLERVYFPSTIQSIGDHAIGYTYFDPDYTALSPVIFGYSATPASTYAVLNGFEFYPFNKGDVNGSNDITPVDASIVLSEYASKMTGQGITISKEQFTLADVNGDGALTPTDASEILSCYAYKATGGNLHTCDYFYNLSSE